MKVCSKCGRKLKGKRWVRPTRKEKAHARLMGDMEQTQCPDCGRDSQSHSAILQVRGRFDLDKVEKFIRKALDEGWEKSRNYGVFYYDGDYYFTSKDMARSVAKKLRDYGAVLHESSKITTHDWERSVPVTKLTIRAQFLVSKGDVVRTRSGPDVVTQVKGKWAWTQNGSKLEVKNAEVLESEEFEGVIASARPPMVLIKDLNRTVEVENLEGEPGDEVWVIKHGNFLTTLEAE